MACPMRARRSALMCGASLLAGLFLLQVTACSDEPPTGEQRVAKVRRTRKPKARGGDEEENRPKVYQANVPTALRTFFVSAGAASEGTGTEGDPWRDLQRALSALEPGDRLHVLPGTYRGPVTIDRPCKDGTASAPIVVSAREDAVITASEGASALVIRRPFWIIQGAEIVSGNSRAPAVVIDGPDAHDVVIDGVHLHNGWGDGLKVGSEVRRLTIANSHIHNFGHPKHGRKSGNIRLEEGVAEITIVGNNIHQGLAGPIVVADRSYGNTNPDGSVETPPGVTLRDNRMQTGWDGS